MGDPVVGPDTTIDMLGLDGEELSYEEVARTDEEEEEENEGNDDLDEMVLKVRLPSLGRLTRRCGDGCRWGYVLRFRGLANAERTPQDDLILERRAEARRIKEEEEEKKLEKEKVEEEEDATEEKLEEEASDDQANEENEEAS